MSTEPERCICGGPAGDCGCALGYADAIADRRRKKPAPLLTAEGCRKYLDCVLRPLVEVAHMNAALEAIASGRVACYDTATHVAISRGDPTRQPNNDEVICPNCTHQFPAISVNDQKRILDSETHVAVPKMTEAEAKKKFARLANNTNMPLQYREMCEAIYTATLLDMKALKP